MSKLLRTELKQIVKECLVEILSEGLLHGKDKLNENNMSRNQNTSKKRARSKHLDNIVYNKNISEKKEKIKKTVLASNITSDPILNELLADTAISTLQEQSAAEGRKGRNTAIPGDNASRIVDQSTPEDLFGESASKWAQLAFPS
jgi:hypothetical protein